MTHISTILLLISFMMSGSFAWSKNPLNSKIEVAAQKAFQNQNYKKVISYLKPLGSNISKNGFTFLGLSFFRSKDYDQATRIFDLALRRYPNNYIYHFHLGEINHEIHKVKKPKFYKKPNAKKTKGSKRKMKRRKEFLTKAVFHLRESIKINPNFTLGYLRLSKIFHENKNIYEQRLIVIKAIEKFGEKPLWISQLCELYFKENFLDRSLEYCKKAILVDPKKDINYLYLSRIFQKNNDLAQSKKALDAGLKKIKTSFALEKEAGEQWFSNKNYKASILNFRKALQIKPKNSEAQVLLAQSYFKIEKYQKALKYFIKACQIDISKKEDFFIATNSLKKIDLQISQKYRAKISKCSNSESK